MSNTSATGGYLLPQAETSPSLDGLTIEQFLQTLIVGVSGMKGDLVRPRWQLNPPKQPDATVDWVSVGLSEEDADTFAYFGQVSSGQNQLMRMEALSLECWFYGPHSLENGRTIRDGLQMTQNLEALQRAGLSFVSTSKMTRAPDLVNERWVNRWIMTVYLRAQTQRTYPILTFVSGSGTLRANTDAGEKDVPIVIEQEG